METKDTEQVLRYLDQHKRDLLAKRESLLKPLQQVDEELAHVTATIMSLQRSVQKSVSPEPVPFSEFPVGKLHGLTQVQALVVIAKSNDGIIRAQEAKRLLIKAGIMRETKNSTNIIHAVIIRSDKFERVGTGVYRLKAREQHESALLPKPPNLQEALKAAFKTFQ